MPFKIPQSEGVQRRPINSRRHELLGFAIDNAGASGTQLLVICARTREFAAVSRAARFRIVQQEPVE